MDRWDRAAWKEAYRRWRLNPGSDLDDWHATARAALWDAAVSFEPERGFTFGTYATWRLKKWTTPLARNEAAAGVHTPAHLGPMRVPTTPFGSIEVGKDGDTDFAGTVAEREQNDQPPDEAGFWDQVGWMLNDERKVKVLQARFVDGRKLDDIGRELGVTKERVRQIEAAALAELAADGELLKELLAE